MEGCARKVAALPSIREARLVAVRAEPKRGWVRRAGRVYAVAATEVAGDPAADGPRFYVHLSEPAAREPVS